jgi:hypothetical protein
VTSARAYRIPRVQPATRAPGSEPSSARRPALRAVQHAVDSDVIPPHRVNDDVRRAGHDQFAGSATRPGRPRWGLSARLATVVAILSASLLAAGGSRSPIYSSCSSRLRSAARSQTILTGPDYARPSSSVCAAPATSVRPPREEPVPRWDHRPLLGSARPPIETRRHARPVRHNLA